MNVTSKTLRTDMQIIRDDLPRGPGMDGWAYPGPKSEGWMPASQVWVDEVWDERWPPPPWGPRTTVTAVVVSEGAGGYGGVGVTPALAPQAVMHGHARGACPCPPLVGHGHAPPRQSPGELSCGSAAPGWLQCVAGSPRRLTEQHAAPERSQWARAESGLLCPTPGRGSSGSVLGCLPQQ